MTEPTPSTDEIWHERLRLLREFYAVGLQILSEPHDIKSSRISPLWKTLDTLWDQFIEMEPQLKNRPLPTDADLRAALLQQAKSNAALFRSLEQHCRQIQQEIIDLLPSLPRSRYDAAPSSGAGTTLHEKA